MKRQALAELVDYYLPLLVQAGDYALAIQPAIGGPGDKRGANAWTQAVTDADLTIQSFFEVATLARDRALGFYGEESARSANARYFDEHAETRINLDPVNGTYLYRHQRNGWDIILSITHSSRLRAVVSYMPAHGVFYLAVDDRALTGTRAAPSLAAMESLRIVPASRDCLTYQAPEVVAALRPVFDAFDLIEDDDPARGLDNLNALFAGRLAAFACRQGDLLDWGAIAWIVNAAGGRATGLDGSELRAFARFDPREREDMLVAASPALHTEILHRLALPA